MSLKYKHCPGQMKLLPPSHCQHTATTMKESTAAIPIQKQRQTTKCSSTLICLSSTPHQQHHGHYNNHYFERQEQQQKQLLQQQPQHYCHRSEKQQQQQPQQQQQQQHYNHSEYFSNKKGQLIQQQQQLHPRQHHFSRCGLLLLIFLTVIKESLTTYSTYTTAAMDSATTTISPSQLLPYFDFDVPRNITVTVGQTGFLHCRVERLADKDVSWIRKRDLHILTAGSTTYTSDQRFQVIRPENSGNWTLQIKYPQPRDSGIYECQINTEPKMSLSYTFNVVELKANIIGPGDLYIKSGSDINIVCKIMQGPHELGNIFWYKGTEIIDTSTNENELDSGTRISMDNDWSDGLTSTLKIRRALPSDTGNYTCVPTIAKSASVYVHVIIGEHPAAMQHNSSNMQQHNNLYLSICCFILTIFTTTCLQHLMCFKNKNNSSNIISKSLKNITHQQQQNNNSNINNSAKTTEVISLLRLATKFQQKQQQRQCKKRKMYKEHCKISERSHDERGQSASPLKRKNICTTLVDATSYDNRRATFAESLTAAAIFHDDGNKRNTTISR